MRAIFSSLLIAASATMFSDVMPRCGGPKVVVQGPGQECGDHGARWRGDCRAPASCFRMETAGPMCSARCASDADCATLGLGFTCSGRATPYETPNETTYQPVCQRPRAE